MLRAFQDNDSFDRALDEPGGLYEFGSVHPFGPNILEYRYSDRHRWMRNIVASQFVGQGLTDEPRFVGWYQDLIAGLSPKAESAALGIRARDEMWADLDDIIDDRRAHPGDDLLTRLIQAELDGQRMSALD